MRVPKHVSMELIQFVKITSIDWRRCYMMGPHRVGVARERYWPLGPSLDGLTEPASIEAFEALYRKCVVRDTPLEGTMEGVKAEITSG